MPSDTVLGMSPIGPISPPSHVLREQFLQALARERGQITAALGMRGYTQFEVNFARGASPDEATIEVILFAPDHKSISAATCAELLVKIDALPLVGEALRVEAVAQRARAEALERSRDDLVRAAYEVGYLVRYHVVEDDVRPCLIPIESGRACQGEALEALAAPAPALMVVFSDLPSAPVTINVTVPGTGERRGDDDR